jgi:hypothetical protein
VTYECNEECKVEVKKSNGKVKNVENYVSGKMCMV